MQTLTVQTLESLTQEKQRELHSILRMEFHTDYVFTDMETSKYSATISMEDTSEVVDVIREQTTKVPDLTIIIEKLDTKEDRTLVMIIQDGKILA